MRHAGAKIIVVVVLSLHLWIPTAAQPEISSDDKATLAEGAKAADEFIDYFRRTLDFGRSWRRYRMKNTSCMLRANGVMSDSLQQKHKPTDAFLEQAYVAVHNMYYLQAAYELSLNKMSDSDKKEPKEIVEFKKRSSYFRDETEDPRTLKEVRRAIAEMNQLSRLYRKYMPKDALRNDVWRANVKYFEEYQPDNNFGVTKGWDQICVSDKQKVYTFERGIFYFYFVRENRRLRIAGFGIGN